MASVFQSLNVASPYHSLNVASPYESVYTRFLAVPGLLLATILVITLLLGDALHYTFPGHFYTFVVANRSSTAFVIQILSHVLGALYVFTLISILNFRTRLTLTRRSVSLSQLTWWNLLCNHCLDTNLPLRYVLVLVVWWGKSEMMPVRIVILSKLILLSPFNWPLSTLGRSNHSRINNSDAAV